MKNIRQKIIDLQNDQTHGASYLALQAINILKKAALDIDAADRISFLQSMNSLAEELKNIRPSMVSIHNLVSDYIEELNQKENIALSFSDLRKKAACIADNIICQAMIKQKQTIQKGSRLIKDKSIVATCSYSSTIAETIKAAYREGKKFDIIIARSSPPGSSYAYGEILAEKLGVPLNIHIIPDENIPSFLPEADYVLLGADTVLADKRVINGYPSFITAETAFKSKKPLYVVCEPHKIARAEFTPHLEDGFELIPAHFITEIVAG